MNHCRDGGYLVDARHTLPADPSDFHAGGLPVVGCTRLRCKQCGATVRQVAGIGFREGVKLDLPALYDAPDPAAAPLAQPQAATRQYLCRCASYPATIYHPLEPDDDDTRAANVPWVCAGHPLVALPHDFDGVVVRDERGLGDLCRAALQGQVPPGARPEDRAPVTYAARLHRRLAGTPLAGAVVAAALAALDDPAALTRAHALQVLASVDAPAGARGALDRLAGDRRLFAGVPDPVTKVRGDTTLEDALWRVAAPLVAAPGKARDLARADALAPGKGGAALYGALAAGDSAWVGAHAEEIARATPAAVAALVSAVQGRFPADVPSAPVVARLRPLLPR